ncbi:MAG: 4-(cytidine 5'-diphospho)-2-C-methyl-D-erythritol kinase [Verrucomicrobiota bacterium]
MKIHAAAKINLSLRVVGCRDDGFHEIDTLMVRLPGLVDEIEIGEEGGFSFWCDDPAIPCDSGNLVVRAVRAFEIHTGKEFRRSVKLAKKIPHGAGLGGGSSDAAAMLRAMAELHGGILQDDLIEIAAGLGSDVPFFLMDGMVRCTGRGEILESAGAAPVLPVLLLKPSFGVATPDAYRNWRGSEVIAGVDYAPRNVDGLMLSNDLERPVFAKHRFLAEMKLWLADRPEVIATLLCGSGATLFAVLRDLPVAEDLAAAARRELDPGLWSWAGTTG